jgi:tetratricopeptide (TPR) repeat protein
MVIRVLLILAIVCGLLSSTKACLNGSSQTLKDSSIIYRDHPGSVPYGHNFYNDSYLKEIIGRLDSLYLRTKDIDFLSDKGLLLIILRRYTEAVKLYLEIEKMRPNRYSTAANIGTAYELLGQNENALKWIKKAVSIDSNSHANSEWIHVKIIEAKIKGKEFTNSHDIINVDFGIDSLPVTTLSKKELQNLFDALFYQLNERMSFVEPKDELVANLLFDLGSMAILLNQLSDAFKIYELAQDYGYKSKLLDERYRQIILESNPALRNIPPPAYVNATSNLIKASLGLILAIVLIVIFVRFWIVKRRKFIQ